MYDGNTTAPTFSPSIQVQVLCKDNVTKICHYFMSEGYIFFADATPSERVPLPVLPQHAQDYIL